MLLQAFLKQHPGVTWKLLSVGSRFVLAAPQPLSNNLTGIHVRAPTAAGRPAKLTQPLSGGLICWGCAYSRSGCSGRKEGGRSILLKPALEAQRSTQKASSHCCLSPCFPSASLTVTDGLVAKIFQFEKSILISEIIFL